jgi:uncharacterized OsmC-like protein/fermentation-respiration switch protein FrsA (DUF1100 family)
MQRSVRFSNSDGMKLAGTMHVPDAGPVRACALFAHCFTCSRNVKAAVYIADALAQQGLVVLRFDFTGLGQSGGDFENTDFSSNVSDLVDAAGFLASEHQAPDILIGHSLGGTAVLSAAHQLDSVVAVATLGAPAEAEHVLNLIEDELPRIESSGKARVKLAGRSFSIRRDFVDDVRAQSVRDGIGELRRALLIMHSPLDEVVPIEEAARIYASARHPKSFVTLDDADHLLSNDRDSRYAARVLVAWVSRYLSEDLAEPPKADFREGASTVAARPQDIFLSAVNADGHRFVADEPEKHGGEGRGPSPYDLLAASLATCTAMTLNMYARRKKLPLDQVEVAVRHDRVHAEDCEDCSSERAKVDVLDREVSLAGDLDSEQRQRLLEIADRCPVHRTLESKIRIRSALRDS